jgi:acyl carrier protein
MDAAMTAGDTRAEEILRIVANETGVERHRLLPEATIEQLGIASIDLTLAVFEIEKQFDVEIPVLAPAADSSGAAGSEFSTVGDLLRHVMAAINARGAA